MKVALLADIHANADALDAVLDAARRAGAERLIVAGDMVGYYYEPDRVLHALDQWPGTIMVRGNHEEMLGRYYRAQAGSRGAHTEAESETHEPISSRHEEGMRVACSHLVGLEIEILAELPAALETTVAGRSVFVCHGSPARTGEYVYPNAAPERFDPFFATGCELIVHGHTHYPNLIRRGDQILVNPGSVGQTRDRIPGACWALWDTGTHTVTQHRQAYDPSRLVGQINAREPANAFLADVLTRTRNPEDGGGSCGS